MSAPTDQADWLVTTTLHDDRRPASEYAAAQASIFTNPPESWPQPYVGHARLAAQALHTLDILGTRDSWLRRPAEVPNAPGAVPRTPQHMSLWELVLIVDTGASMAAWYPTVDAFVAGAHRMNLFPQVHVVKLHSQGHDPDRPLFDQNVLANSGLAGDTGKKIVLVISDTVGPAWGRAPLRRQLRSWASQHVVAIVHVQPHSDWGRTYLRTEELEIRSATSGDSNGRYKVRTADESSLDAYDKAPSPHPEDVVIPVMELNKRWIEQWCLLVYSKNWVAQKALIIPSTPCDDQLEHGVDLRRRLITFLRTSRPGASELATLLAAAPLNRHIMQLVATLLAPETGPRHLADVLNSGLIQVVNTQDPANAQFDQVVFDFLPGIRAELLSRQRNGHTDCVEVAGVIQRYLGKTIPAVVGLEQRIDCLTPPGDMTITAQNLAYVEVERAIFEAQTPGPHLPALQKLGANIDAFKLCYRAGEPGALVGQSAAS